MSTFGPISAPALTPTTANTTDKSDTAPAAVKNTFPQNVSFIHVSVARILLPYQLLIIKTAILEIPSMLHGKSSIRVPKCHIGVVFLYLLVFVLKGYLVQLTINKNSDRVCYSHLYNGWELLKLGYELLLDSHYVECW